MKFKFKPFGGDKTSAEGSSPDTPPGATAKRKEQLRRAQKTLRERKEAYTKSLELEVVHLRANEANILQETRRLYNEITILRNALQQHGIETSSLIEQSGPWHDQVEQRPFEFALSPNQGKHSPSRIDVRRRAIEQAPSRSDDRNAHRSHRSDSTSRRNRPLPILPSAPPAEDFTDLSITPTPPPQLNKLDYTSIGVDFVLSLEAPCLAHIPPDPTSTPEPYGHSLMLSATILHQHPSPSHVHSHSSSSHTDHHHHDNQQSHQPWTISPEGIERLLTLSYTIPLADDELTPVQAWDQLRRHPRFETLGKVRWEKLKGRLLAGVACYGFGGVVTRQAFDGAVEEAFAGGQGV